VSATKTFVVVQYDGSRVSVKATRFKVSPDRFVDFFAGEECVAVAAPGWSIVTEHDAIDTRTTKT
jgi:hypothetical protein